MLPFCFLHSYMKRELFVVLVVTGRSPSKKWNPLRQRMDSSFVLYPSASAHLPQQLALSLLQGFFVSEDESLHFRLHHLGFDLHLLGHGLDLLHAQLRERKREKNICNAAKTLWIDLMSKKGTEGNFTQISKLYLNCFPFGSERYPRMLISFDNANIQIAEKHCIIFV